jgi:hypothetical protein
MALRLIDLGAVGCAHRLLVWGIQSDVLNRISPIYQPAVRVYGT